MKSVPSKTFRQLVGGGLDFTGLGVRTKNGIEKRSRSRSLPSTASSILLEPVTLKENHPISTPPTQHQVYIFGDADPELSVTASRSPACPSEVAQKVVYMIEHNRIVVGKSWTHRKEEDPELRIYVIVQEKERASHSRGQRRPEPRRHAQLSVA